MSVQLSVTKPSYFCAVLFMLPIPKPWFSVSFFEVLIVLFLISIFLGTGFVTVIVHPFSFVVALMCTVHGARAVQALTALSREFARIVQRSLLLILSGERLPLNVI